ncbi:putative methyltransferase-domain-containing protein [Xylaria palmicola]|nr:putative methyltransferase-domain-containing protein [Xylaria palmicola]
MHYIRLLRPAKIQREAAEGGPAVSLLFTMTTDLGDSFLCPEDGPMELVVAPLPPADDGDDAGGGIVLRGRQTCRCTWKAGMRVLEARVRLPPGSEPGTVSGRLAIYPAQQQQWRGATSSQLGALHVGDMLPWRADGGRTSGAGVVMPATIELVDGACAPVSVRTLSLGIDAGAGDGKKIDLQFEEDTGESIARHIWDAGVVTAAYLADKCAASSSSSSPERVREVFPIDDDESFRVLELGSGVGILGITIANILPAAAAAQGRTLRGARVLLTDLPEAEERARSNIAKASAALGAGPVTIEYENLDWDEGCEGRFGPLAAAAPWDLVVLSDCTYNVDSLPALVGTLSALHAAKERHRAAAALDSSPVRSSVLLATKPRHSSEEALFGLLAGQGWAYRVIEEIPLPKIGEDDEVVQIYLLEKGGRV